MILRCPKAAPRLLAITALALLAPAAQAAAATPPAIEGSWTVRATVTSATGGARPLAGAKRQSVYDASDCTAPCLVTLAERLPGGGHPQVAFTRAGRTYSGSARTRLRCAGDRVRARVNDRFQITRREPRGGRRLAANLAGKAILTGSCGGSAARMVVRWTAARSDLPEPPTPSFSSAPEPVSLSAEGGIVTFSDASADDVDGGRIIRSEWDFGDPASGAGNLAEGTHVSHAYTTVGTFTVKLTVTDDDGLHSTVRDIVTVDP